MFVSTNMEFAEKLNCKEMFQNFDVFVCRSFNLHVYINGEQMITLYY